MTLLIFFLVTVSLLLSIQGALTIMQMIYAWEDPSQAKYHTSPQTFLSPHYSFTALIPARHEKRVIEDTIKAVAAINYPETLKEIIVICRVDDYETILKAQQTIETLQKNNIHLITYDTPIINKPHALNHGLTQATKDVVVVFDAEDEPHPDIYSVTNTVMVSKKADVIQSGVQLMDYQSHWYSPLNVLEYFFWFKSSLMFFAQKGFILLGGNTVFIKKKWLDFLQGWDDTCLTEDADIGIRLSSLGARIQVVYDERHATKEETPPTLLSFMKQRSRWNQGFLQVLFKGDYLALPRFSQICLALYSLTAPLLQALLFFYLPISLFIMLSLHLPIPLTLLTITPLYLLLIQLVISLTGLFEFTRAYHLRFSPFLPIKVLVTFLPFQFFLGISTLWALFRTLTNDSSWEKTAHTNIHRSPWTEEYPASSVAVS